MASQQNQGGDLEVLVFFSAVGSVLSAFIHAKIIKCGLSGFIAGLNTVLLGTTLSQYGMYKEDEPPDSLLAVLLSTVLVSPLSYFKRVGFSGRSVFGYLMLLCLGLATPRLLSWSINTAMNIKEDMERSAPAITR